MAAFRGVAIALVLCACGAAPTPAQQQPSASSAAAQPADNRPVADVDFRSILSKLAPRDPEASLDSMQVRSGCRVELVCAEPLVRDPIAIDWGPDGRLWVVEMGDYPVGEDAESAVEGAEYGDPEFAEGAGEFNGGRVRYLEDTDGDGRYDSATLFLDGLAFPTSVMVWGEGVLITCAPDILYAVDADGDGRADRQQVLFTGFVKGNPQHCVNGLHWGLDNWIYGANGDSGGIVTSKKTGERIDIHGRDFRFRPRQGVFQTQTGMSQYGRCRDDWGNWFGGRNLQPAWHCALDDQYLRRNPYLTPPDPCVDLLDPPTCPPVFPISEPLPRFNEFWTMNRFTAACGITIYRDTLLGKEFDNNLFVCEPTYNLVSRAILEPEGTTFSARRAADEQQSEFLASTDHWFRPVQSRTGPDGGLYIVDMYRLVIEHPDYIPDKWHEQLDFDAGRGRGRIYRVLPVENSRRKVSPLDRLETKKLVAQLASPNGPRRDMVQRLLVERSDAAAVAPLRRLALHARRARTRLSALCTLAGLEAIDDDLLTKALSDRHAGVRRHAVRLCEASINECEELHSTLLERISDPDPQVRLQLAYTFGWWENPRAGAALAKLARQHAEDPLMIAAVMSSATRFPGEILRALLSESTFSEAQQSLVSNLLRLTLEAEQTEALGLAVRRLAEPGSDGFSEAQYRLIADLFDAVEYGGETLAEFSARAPRRLREALADTDALLRSAAREALDPAADDARRIAALRLYGRSLHGNAAAARPLSELLTPQTAVDVQTAAVEALARLEPADLPELLLRDWPRHSPELRPRIVEILLREKQWSERLLEFVESGVVAPNELGSVSRNRLILHYSADVRRTASRLLEQEASRERLEVIQRYQQGFQASVNVSRGRELFRKHCSTCHRLEGEGTNIGPDLLALTDRSEETLLVGILDPNRAVEPRYVEYVAVTTRGRVYSGMVLRETGNSLTLVDAQGKEHQLVRSDVVEFRSTGKSLMPVAIESLFENPDELLDVVAYLRTVEADPASQRPAVDAELSKVLQEQPGSGKSATSGQEIDRQ